MSVEKKLRLKSCNFLRNQNFSCVCFVMNQSPTVLDNLNEEDASGLFCGFYGKCYFLKVVFLNVSWCVWIIFCLNWKTFFFFVYMLSLNLPLQILQSGVFPNEPLIWFAILVADLRIILPHSRYSEQVCSIVSGLLFSFDEKFAQEPTQLCWRDVCGLYFWHLQCLWNCRLWFGKDGRHDFKTSWKHWRLVFVFSLSFRLIWFFEMAKLSVLSNFKRMT